MKTQKGFGLIPVLLILILVSVVGATGYYVYSQQANNKTEVAGNSSVKVSPTPSSTPIAQPTAKPVDTQKYLIIKELSIKIPVPEDLSSATYSYENNSGYEFATISMQDSKITTCKWTYVIKKATKPYTDGDPVGIFEPVNLAKIGASYYTGEQGDSAVSCVGDLSDNDVKKLYGIGYAESRDLYLSKITEAAKKMQQS